MSISENNFPYELVKAFPEFMVTYLQHAEEAANDPEDPFIIKYDLMVDFRKFAIKIYAQTRDENPLQSEFLALFNRIVSFVELLLSSSEKYLVDMASAEFLYNLKSQNPRFHEMSKAFGPKAIERLRLMYPNDNF